MAFINITGDSDGDLHTAAMHNSKFGAIASVLNGNIDEENLKYPKSTFMMSFSAGPGSQPVANVLSESYIEINGSGGATPLVNTHNNGTSDVNVLMSSWIKVPFAATLLNANVIWVAQAVAGNTNMTAIVQRADTLTGVYTTIASTSGLSMNHTGFLMRDSAVSISSSGISTGQYIRCAWINDATTAQYPPKCTFNLQFKANHIA